MARKNRRDSIDPREVGGYHFNSKCVRGAKLLGKDGENDYSHRRSSVSERVQLLAAWFAVDILFHGAMSNHFHIMLVNRPDVVDDWSDEEVIQRAIKIFPYKFKRMGVKDGEPTEKQLATFVKDEKLVDEMRRRLSDPSWFMKQLKQKIATDANKEDGCVGHFFIGRFHHRVIVDLVGLLVCGIYLDLQQVAACEVETPEESMHTSAGRRILGRELRKQGNHSEAQKVDGFLTPISHLGDDQQYPPAGTLESLRLSDQGRLEITLDRYLELLDWVSRLSRPGKPGKTPDGLPALLDRLDLDADALRLMVDNYNTTFSESVGSIDAMTAAAHERGERTSRDAERLATLFAANGVTPKPDKPLDNAPNRIPTK